MAFSPIGLIVQETPIAEADKQALERICQKCPAKVIKFI